MQVCRIFFFSCSCSSSLIFLSTPSGKGGWLVRDGYIYRSAYIHTPPYLARLQIDIVFSFSIFFFSLLEISSLCCCWCCRLVGCYGYGYHGPLPGYGYPTASPRTFLLAVLSIYSRYTHTPASNCISAFTKPSPLSYSLTHPSPSLPFRSPPPPLSKNGRSRLLYI